jgi:signal transduction histidine kinase
MHDTRYISGVKLAMRAVRARIVKLLAPVSASDDGRRQELILNIILIISIPFLAFADILIGRNTLRLGIHYHGIPFWIATVVVVAFIALFVASKRGYARAVSYTLIGLYALAAIYSGWHWGASLPATLLTVALVSVISSILIGSRFGFFMSGILIAILSFLAYHEIHTLGTQPWKYETVTFMDILIYSAILLFIAALSWLSNREIQKSLNRARSSEKSLAEERDHLEIKVAERTESLREAQAQRVAELSQTAEFGRMSQGLFHDLMTPLTSVAIHMETLRDVDIPEIQNSRAYVEKAMRASERMGTFMSYIRRSIHSQSPISAHPSEENAAVDIGQELSVAIDLLGYKARNADVDIRITTDKLPLYQGNSLHFLQIFLNLISNGIDACEKTPGSKVVSVNVGVSKEKDGDGRKKIKITVHDNGSGIAERDRVKIFDEFYTTKHPRGGTGLGLSTVKKIVEKDLNGSITVESGDGKGTTFTILFPVLFTR